MDLDVLRQDLLVEFLRLRLDPLQHVLGLRAGTQRDHALHRVVLLLETELAQPRRDADHHPTDILDQHRVAVVHRQHHVADVLQRLQPADAAHVIELPALRVEAAAGVAVVRRQRGLHLLRGEPDPGDLRRIEQHLVLHAAATETGVVGHAGHGAVLRLDHPVLERLQLHRRAIGALQHVAIDQSRRRRQRRHRRLHPVGKIEIAQPVEHFLAREVVVGAVVEGERHHRQAVQRDRTGVVGFRNAGHALLGRHRDQPLHFLGSMAGPLRDDLDAGRRQVRIGVHRQAVQRVHAGADQHQHQQRDQKALRQRGADDPVHQRRRARRHGRQMVAHWFCMNCTKRPPSTTIRSPGSSPSLTSY